MSNSFKELVTLISEQIIKVEERKRSRTEQEKISFTYALTHLLKDLWLNSKTLPPQHSVISKRSNNYSNNNRYVDPLLSYRNIISAFNGLVLLQLIEVTEEGFYDRVRMQGKLTRFVATDELKEQLLLLNGHPVFMFKQPQNDETIILRNEVEGRNAKIEYEDTADTLMWRKELSIINTCLLRHWADLRILDSEIPVLSERLEYDNSKLPINFANRTLTRIFTNGSFSEGGRFYRGWWQNVPSEYRPYITLNEHVTQEHDYSQLSPNMIYFMEGKELGNEDAYDRILNGEHRKTCKQAFNAMIQASTSLRRKPDKLNIDHIDMSWIDLRQRILDTHKPIEHLFFSGVGNQMQFEDSCIASNVMLQFANENEPILPIHDSFIMRSNFSGELEEAMRRAFHDRFKKDIPIKSELLVTQEPLFNSDGSPRTKEVVTDDRKHSQWYDRKTMWLYYKDNQEE